MKAAKVIRTIPVKVLAFLLCITLLAVAAAGVFGAVLLAESDAYTSSKAQFERRWMKEQVYSVCHEITAKIEGWIYPDMQTDRESNLRYAVYTPGGTLLETNVADPSGVVWQYDFAYDFSSNEASPSFGEEDDGQTYREAVPYGYYDRTYCVYAALTPGLPYTDQFSVAGALVSAAYSLRFAIYGIIFGAALLAICCFVLLMCGAARRPDTEELRPGPLTRVPFDLITVLGACAFLLPVMLLDQLNVNSVAVWVLALAAYILYALALVLGWCMSLAARIKLGGWWRNTVVVYALRLVRYVLCQICRVIWALLRGVRKLLRSIPLVWKSVLGYAALSVVELIVIAATYYESDTMLVWWVCEHMVLLPVIVYLALALRRLQRGGQALADGELSYQVDTSRMFWDFKRHGENLNSIAVGMSRAVDERMKSERLKTELITNVSHDIKTPLTSIINYTDLIAAEPTENEKIAEYCAVLQRQSDRLKKLIGDLVEASKASSGSMEVELAPCEVGVLLTQTAGEYEQRIQDCDLNLVISQPAGGGPRIMADGRLLWRVFDNLMNNICKYSQPLTRVYLNLEETDGFAVITFKNTSRYALNVSTEELLERFVRGDSARSTEGSGLGLSIAQSLTELQGGMLALSCDGDLFKAAVKFPVIPK